MGYINSAAGLNGATGSLGRYSYMGDHQNSGLHSLYRHLYHKIDMSSPEMDDMPSQAAPGASMATQAKAAGYQDMFRNIQAMRDAEYDKEIKRGEITSEFSGFGYADQPEKGLFNPPSSLYTSDATLYSSLYASKEKPGKAWTHNIHGFSEEEKSPIGPIIVIIAVLALYAMTSF